jgi:hypothetical protein
MTVKSMHKSTVAEWGLGGGDAYRISGVCLKFRIRINCREVSETQTVAYFQLTQDVNSNSLCGKKLGTLKIYVENL